MGAKDAVEAFGRDPGSRHRSQKVRPRPDMLRPEHEPIGRHPQPPRKRGEGIGAGKARARPEHDLSSDRAGLPVRPAMSATVRPLRPRSERRREAGSRATGKPLRRPETEQVLHGSGRRQPDKRAAVRARGNRRNRDVRAAFAARGTSFHARRKQERIDPHDARKAVLGLWVGPAADRILKRIVAALGRQE